MNISHNPQAQRFEYAQGDAIAVCSYSESHKVWNLNHTFVPDAFRGQGVAAQLAQTALEHIAAQGGRVIPSCSYIAAYIQRHPQYQALLKT